MRKDMTGMTPEQIRKENYARLMTNAMFVVADCLEALVIECEEANKDAGYYIVHDAKRNLNTAKFGLNKFRSLTKMLPTEEQLSFGDDGEITLDLFMAALSRTGTNQAMMVRFINYMMSFPDRVGLDEFRTHGGETFKGIIQQKYGERNNTHAHDDVLPRSSEPV